MELRIARRKVVTRTHTVEKWLRDRISSVDIGMKYEGKPRHFNKNANVLEYYGFLHRGEQPRFYLARLTNADFADHFAGRKTLYMAGNQANVKETLACIDIDCHHSGTLAGAIAFAEHLRTIYRGLYYETSTNGNGVHCYFILQKDGVGAEMINELLGRLQHYLRTLMIGFDVENVEVKGTLPVFKWGQQKLELQNYTSGQLCKLPREAASRFEELQNTARLTIHDLMKLRLPERQDIKETRLVQKNSGSITGRGVTDDALAKMPHYRAVAELLLGHHPLATSGRAVATAEDIAITFLVVTHCMGSMYADGSLPTARIKGLWDSLYDAGDVERQHDCKRFAVVRNYLSSLGLIDWEDHNYVVGKKGPDGKRHGGQAAKWQFSAALVSWLGDTRERETSIEGTTLSQSVQSLVRLPFSETIRPVEIPPPPPIHLQPDRITEILANYDQYWTAA